jgi:ParB/RepB/Spo0J family partition protein
MPKRTELTEVPTHSLFPHPMQPRTALSAETIASVQQAILTEGGRYPQSMAVTVRPRAAGGYEVLAGHHRVEGARQAGAAKVWAFVRELEDDEAAIFLAASNSQTSMRAIEHGRHALLMLEQYGLTVPDYALRVGKSKHWAYQAIAAYRVVAVHGGLDHPYARLPYSALAPVGRFQDPGVAAAVLDVMMKHANPGSIANALCAAVAKGDHPEVAICRIDREQRPKRATVERDVSNEQGKHCRPDLAIAGYRGEWLASWVEGIAFALEVRQEELDRRRPNLDDPMAKKAFDDAVEARVRREWQAGKAKTADQRAAPPINEAA